VRPGRAADHSPSSSAAVMEEWSYTSTHPLGHTGPVTGSLYIYFLLYYVFWVLVLVCFRGTENLFYAQATYAKYIILFRPSGPT